MFCTCSQMDKVKKCFSRKSSGRVCPEDLPLNEEQADNTAESKAPKHTSDSSAGTPVDGNKNPNFLFAGGHLPVPCDPRPETDDCTISISQLYNSMNDGQLSPYLFDPMYMLIVDTRPKEDYMAQHINTAFQVSEMEEHLKHQSAEEYTLIVLYDNKGLSHSLRDSTLSHMYDTLRAQKVEPYVLTGGFDTFQTKHPYLCSNVIVRSERQRQLLIKNYPSIVLDDLLYLGRGDQATNETVITNLGITHIVNVTREHPDPFSDYISYLRIELEDDTSSNLLKELPNAVEFISNAIAGGGRVLVHCNLGVSRSATVTIAFLMHSNKWILRDAHDYLKDRRPIIRPNHGFVNQLSCFEELLYDKKLTDVERLFDICIETDAYGH